FRIKQGKQVIRAVPAAGAKDGLYVIAQEHLFQLTRMALRRPRKVQIALENRIAEDWVVTQLPQRVTSRLELFAIEITRGRNDCNRVSAAKRGRFDACGLTLRRHAK